jgi:hypothetical protein
MIIRRMGQVLGTRGVTEDPRKRIIAIQNPTLQSDPVDASKTSLEKQPVARLTRLQFQGLSREPSI